MTTISAVVGFVASVITVLGALAATGRYIDHMKGLPLRTPSVKDVLNAANVIAIKMERPLSRVEFAQRIKDAEARIKAQEKTKMPPWAFSLMTAKDAQRYAWEWGAHLHQLIEEGELRQARRDRRRLVLAAITLAVALRVRRALGRAR